LVTESQALIDKDDIVEDILVDDQTVIAVTSSKCIPNACLIIIGGYSASTLLSLYKNNYERPNTWKRVDEANTEIVSALQKTRTEESRPEQIIDLQKKGLGSNLEPLFKALNTNVASGVTKLLLSGNLMSTCVVDSCSFCLADKHLDMLKGCLNKMPDLLELDLRNNRVSSLGYPSFFEALSVNCTKLTFLDLSFTLMQDSRYVL
jgi:hypothetical protein